MSDQGPPAAGVASVPFDHAAALDAAEACERAARLVRDVTLRRVGLARSALVNGRGPWRDELVRQLAALDRQAVEVEAKLRAAAQGWAEASALAAKPLDLGHLNTDSVPK
jgi:hypothetical protein